MQKIGMLITKAGHDNFAIFYDDSVKVNPYRLYNVSGKHRLQVARYADLASCTAYINNYVMEHNEEER